MHRLQKPAKSREGTGQSGSEAVHHRSGDYDSMRGRSVPHAPVVVFAFKGHPGRCTVFVACPTCCGIVECTRLNRPGSRRPIGCRWRAS
jgi:hypothetical protein